MIFEKDIVVGLKVSFNETVDFCDCGWVHRAKCEDFSYELTNGNRAPIRFSVDFFNGDKVTLCSVENFNGKPYAISVRKNILSEIGQVWLGDDTIDWEVDFAKKRAFVISNIGSTASGEQVNHPSHYSWLKDLCGVEPIDICRHFGFSVGNALKYLMRKGKVDGDKTEKEKRIEDLKKAVFYLQDEIKRLENDKQQG